MFNKRVNSWMSVFGLLGVLGFLGFIMEEPIFLTFFTFFGFFGFYWEGKLNKERIDERLKDNFSKAQRYGYRLGMTLIFLTIILCSREFSNYKNTLMLQMTLISLVIAITLILVPMLTYHFDKGNLDD
ncbi:DUF3796 domain-containing protein [Vagococcus elongatus]|nr:DUF3796 domain-containing protein [Vagococcus elongatus]